MNAGRARGPGLFGPGSVMWRVNRERAVLLGGPAAAVLQVAHPQVARGVACHSRFREDSAGRLARTLDAVYTVAFGDTESVEQVSAQVARAHAAVRGEGYSAFDPAAQLWVMATLISGSVTQYQRFVGPLAPPSLDRLLAENRVFGEVFGLPWDALPKTWGAFLDYWRGMLQGDLLGSDPLCADVASAVVRPVRPLWLRALAPLFANLAAAEMPAPLARRLRLPDPHRARSRLAPMRKILPPLIRRAPPALRYAPQYLAALTRRSDAGNWHREK